MKWTLPPKRHVRCIRTGISALLLCGLSALTFLAPPPAVAWWLEPAIKHGAVMARAMVLDENGQPILVEMNDDGTEAGTVNLGAYSDRVRELTIISAAEYRQQQQRLDNWFDEHKDGLARDARVLTRAQAEAEPFRLANGEPMKDKLVLGPATQSILVRGESQRFLDDANHLTLLSFTVDLTQSYAVPETGSLVLNPEGRIVASAPRSIQPRVGFYGDPNNPQGAGGRRGPDDEIFGPVPHIRVYVDEFVFPGGVSTTDVEGKYSLSFYLPPCPPSGFTYTTDVWAELRYQTFSPFGAPSVPYYLRRPDSTSCTGMPIMNPLNPMAYVDALASYATRSILIQNLDLWVDVMFLSGHIEIQNLNGEAVEISDLTRYEVFDNDHHSTPTTTEWYDFDGDGKNDIPVRGVLVNEPNAHGHTVEVFYPEGHERASGEPTVQGIFFSGNTQPNLAGEPATAQPDVIRQLDTDKRLEPTGLLASISEADLQNTDLLVFRESTGQLILERQGLREAEVAGRGQIGAAEGDALYYDLMLRGPDDHDRNVGGGTSRAGGWSEWASRYQMTPEFQRREANHLSSGEWIRLIAINRATGYLASQRVQLTDASQTGGSLNIPVETLVLRPPNLKIWAERHYDIDHGLSAGDQRTYLIGAEGVGLASDQLIQLYTEWYDHDGRPLPEGLGVNQGADYGLTGRLARVVDTNRLEPVAQSGLANFSIAPGQQTQMIQVRDNLNLPEHYYIHVSGTPQSRTPQFDTRATTQPPLEHRPGLLTPFKTPLYDEQKDWTAFTNWHQTNQSQDLDGDDRLNKPEPYYAWHYRPEYQFSRLALEVQSIERQFTDENDQTHTLDLLSGQRDDGKIPTIRGDDDLVSIFYSLIAPQVDRLSPIDGPQELVLSLGAEELAITLDKDQHITFHNLAHIDRLDPADLLTIRLYSNQDAGNILWEYAFTRNGLHVYYKIPGNTEDNNEGRDDIEILGLLQEGDSGFGVVTQPEPVVRTLGGLRLRYRYVPPSVKGVHLQSVTWSINHRGRYCFDYGVDDPIGQCHIREAGIPYTQTDFQPEESASVYWEPLADAPEPPLLPGTPQVRWDLWAGENTGDDGVQAHLRADYTIPSQANPTVRLPRYYNQEFVIKTRELNPNGDTDGEGESTPMQGSDVAMLEAMLWQLGISPQHAFPGKEGDRLGDESASLKGIIGGVAGPEGRSRFSTGLTGATGSGSLERMIRRYQARNSVQAGVHGNADPVNRGDVLIQGVDSVVSIDTLNWLHRDWRSYYSAYQHYAEDPNASRLNQHSTEMDDWLEAALAIWDEGWGDYVEATYTEQRHHQMLQSVGLSADAKDRRALLRAWKLQESDTHWGGKSPFRLVEGGADEMGSMSFNQVLYRYRYGSTPCTVHYESGLNYYHPRDNMKGFMLHLGAQRTVGAEQVNCPGGFDSAYGSGTASLIDYERAELVGYQQGETAVVALDESASENDYELLARAIGSYNGGLNFWTGLSWPELLVRSSYTPVAERANNFPAEGGGECSSCTYVLDIFERYGLPMRTYIWHGGTYDDEMPLLTEDGTPQLDENGEHILDPRAGQDWCFAFGEREWMGGEVYEDVALAASPEDEFGDPKIPVGQMDCVTGEAL